ncbi:MAG: hypothetical protein PHW64_08405 [Sulfuricurvum sp.]|nr:hypothetical protein [Sulfuricurvum sp.]
MKFLWTLFSIIFLLHANEPQEHPKLPLSQSLPLLQTIEHHALVLGEGSTKVYVFIDPFCPNSRNFIALIDENAKMRSKYTYYFFLYELKRFNSAPMIAKIYSSSNPIDALKRVMILDQNLPEMTNPSVSGKILQISNVAQALDVYKRPYIIMVKREN